MKTDALVSEIAAAAAATTALDDPDDHRPNGWISFLGMPRDCGVTGGIMERVEPAIRDAKRP